MLGDLSEPEDFLSDIRINKVTHVINCAAVASFGNNPLIWKVNVEGTLAFAERMAQVEGLKRFLHVGTAMSCAPEPGSLVAESAEFEDTAEHLVEYTRSKSTIEQLMRQRCPQLPLVIARPSIVVGHTRLGCQPSSSIFWVFSMALMLRQFMCSLQDNIDVIPVDYCADAMVMLLNRETLDNDVYHISAGEECSVSFADINRAMAVALEKAPVGDAYAQVNYDVLVKMRRQLKDIFRAMQRAANVEGDAFVRNPLPCSTFVSAMTKSSNWVCLNRRVLPITSATAYSRPGVCPFSSKWWWISNNARASYSPGYPLKSTGIFLPLPG